VAVWNPDSGFQTLDRSDSEPRNLVACLTVRPSPQVVVVDRKLRLATAGAWQTWIVTIRSCRGVHGSVVTTLPCENVERSWIPLELLEGFINAVVRLLHSDTIPDEDSSESEPATGFLAKRSARQLASYSLFSKVGLPSCSPGAPIRSGCQ